MKAEHGWIELETGERVTWARDPWDESKLVLTAWAPSSLFSADYFNIRTFFGAGDPPPKRCWCKVETKRRREDRLIREAVAGLPLERGLFQELRIDRALEPELRALAARLEEPDASEEPDDLADKLWNDAQAELADPYDPLWPDPEAP